MIAWARERVTAAGAWADNYPGACPGVPGPIGSPGCILPSFRWSRRVRACSRSPPPSALAASFPLHSRQRPLAPCASPCPPLPPPPPPPPPHPHFPPPFSTSHPPPPHTHNNIPRPRSDKDRGAGRPHPASLAPAPAAGHNLPPTPRSPGGGPGAACPSPLVALSPASSGGAGAGGETNKAFGRLLKQGAVLGGPALLVVLLVQLLPPLAACRLLPLYAATILCCYWLLPPIAATSCCFRSLLPVAVTGCCYSRLLLWRACRGCWVLW